MIPDFADVQFGLRSRGLQGGDHGWVSQHRAYRVSAGLIDPLLCNPCANTPANRRCKVPINPGLGEAMGLFQCAEREDEAASQTCTSTTNSEREHTSYPSREYRHHGTINGS